MKNNCRKMRKRLTKNFWNKEYKVWAVQKHVNLVDLVKSFRTNIFLENLASTQKRTSPIKIDDLAEKSDEGSIGEGPNHSKYCYYSDQSSVRILWRSLSEFRIFCLNSLENSISKIMKFQEFSTLKFKNIFGEIHQNLRKIR